MTLNTKYYLKKNLKIFELFLVIPHFLSLSPFFVVVVVVVVVVVIVFFFIINLQSLIHEEV